jgi:hypothetical protein
MKVRDMMSRPPRRLIQLPLVSTFVLCLLAGVYLLVWKRFAKTGPSAEVRGHAVDTRPDEALKYWTADKMRNARGAALPDVDSLERERQGQRRPPRSSAPRDA